MALTALTKRKLSYLCRGWGRAGDIVTIAEDGSGTIDAATKRALVAGMGNMEAATNLVTALNADSALGNYAQTRLANGMGSQTGAADLSGELG